MPVNTLVLKRVQRVYSMPVPASFRRKDDMILWKCAKNSIPHSVTSQNVNRAGLCSGSVGQTLPFEPYTSFCFPSTCRRAPSRAGGLHHPPAQQERGAHAGGGRRAAAGRPAGAPGPLQPPGAREGAGRPGGAGLARHHGYGLSPRAFWTCLVQSALVFLSTGRSACPGRQGLRVARGRVGKWGLCFKEGVS